MYEILKGNVYILESTKPDKHYVCHDTRKCFEIMSTNTTRPAGAPALLGYPPCWGARRFRGWVLRGKTEVSATIDLAPRETVYGNILWACSDFSRARHATDIHVNCESHSL